MTVTLQIDVQDQDVVGLISRIRAVMAPTVLKEFMEVGVQPWLTERIARRFDAEGDDVVGKWVALRAATAAIREAKGYPGQHPINVRTGEMKRWLMQPGIPSANARGATLRLPAAGSAELMQKLRTAQVGRSDPSTQKRPVLGMNEVDAAAIMARFHSWFIGEVGRVNHLSDSAATIAAGNAAGLNTSSYGAI